MAAKSTKDFSAARKKLIAAAHKALPKNQQKTAGELANPLFGRAPLEDLSQQSADYLAMLLQKAYKVTQRGAASISVDDHDDGQTLVTLAMTNRPFIVDSVLAEIVALGHAIRLVLHPLLERSGRGMTSLVMVVLETKSAAASKELKTSLAKTMDQVRLVTGDWQPMLARLGETVAELRTTPPPIPAEEIAETIQFIEWLSGNNFTFMGMREYAWKGDRKSGELTAVPKSAFGILKDPSLTVMTRGGEAVVMTPEIRDFLNSSDPLIISKANVKSRVHRRIYMDYIGIKRYDRDGGLAGELRVVGLFTSSAYTKSVLSIPLLRRKAHAVLEHFKADPSSHSGKALTNIIETWPRDEMFQISAQQLAGFSESVAQLEERPRIRVLARADRFDRFASVIVYVPRDRYDSSARKRIGDYLAEAFDGRLSAFYPAFQENGMTRVHFIIGRDQGKTPSVPQAQLERNVTEIIRTWNDRFQSLASNASAGHEFSVAYQEAMAPEDAVRDSALLECLDSHREISVEFHDADTVNNDASHVGLKLFHLKWPVPLSRRVPVFENLGFHVIEEVTFDIGRADGKKAFLHDMHLKTATGQSFDRKKLDGPLSECLQAVWQGRTDDDKFNGLILAAGLTWKQCTIFRAYARYLRQIRSRFTVESMAETLATYPAVTRILAELFEARFNPKFKSRDKVQQKLADDIVRALEQINSSDDDRIIRNFQNLIGATLRTNFYQDRMTLSENAADHQIDGAPTPVLAFKVDPSAVSIMPQPVPYRELFVSSSRVEGLHLRFGPVARGGLRWSDRAQDYRTEVLGLVKAQQVKNAVIVPVGSKGGFVPKQLPSRDDRNAWFEEGRAAYKIYISSLLSITDNLVNSKVVPPKQTVRHDGDDPYFVVAADKGTSTFSDTANGISQAYDFWLDDAFASGGSAGYDHKKMGITARGGWEAVKRHFREISRDGKAWDIQSEPFTTAGVGDMSGDVFGNGMLLSKQTRLIAAFDHRDIFIDPNPDTKTSFKERERLFKADRSSWQDYNTKLISKGGGVFSRSAKSITLSKPAAEALGCDAGSYTPQELMRIIMKAPVDLMWFGGIGTYIKAGHESDAEVGDRANDAIRVMAKEVRAKVIGEGANLGVTQDGRIAFNMLGGRSNSDAIDNSAGVNSSDVEVNIKIALAAAMKSSKLTRPKRNTLLESMTSNVADLVLRNNYLQTLAISLAERRGMEDFAHQQRLMQQLEQRDLLDRHVENLPDDAALAERAQADEALTRAEIGVLLAYAKIVALDDLVATDVPDDDYLERELFRYFPDKMRDKYAGEIRGHRLRREIIGTVLANSMINRGGPTFASRILNRTGASIDQIARAYVAVRDAFNLQSINDQIDALDAKINGDLQLELYAIVQERVLEQTVWFVRYGDFSKGIGNVAKEYGEAVSKLMPKIDGIVPDFLANRIADDRDRFVEGGVPKALAHTLARLPIAALIPDIQLAAHQTGKTLDATSKVFFDITNTFRIGRMVQAARNIDAEDYYDALALDRALQSLHVARRAITIDVMKGKGSADDWIQAHEEAVTRTRKQMGGIIENDQATVSRLTVAANILGDLARG